VDRVATPNNENSELLVKESCLVVEGGRVGVECVTLVWHEAEELELQLASVISLGGKKKRKAYCDGLRTCGNTPVREIQLAMGAGVGNCEGNKGCDVCAVALFDVSIGQSKLSC
jgi:hypothetical protein